MTFFKENCGWILLVLVVGLAVLAPWLSAHLFIRVLHETMLQYLLLFLSLGAGVYWVQISLEGRRVRRVLLALIVSLVGLGATLVAVRTANARFVAEKFSMISSDEWRQIIAALKQLQQDATVQSSESVQTERIPRKNPPPSFEKLGRFDEYTGGGFLTVNNETASHIKYSGGRYRKWGVCVGPDHLLDMALRSTLKRYPIREGAYFFCGADY